jgi:hypothetical protein
MFVHVYHAIHHNFTTKKPRSAHYFSQNTLKNAQKTARTSSRTALQFFRQKRRGLGLQDGLEEHTGTNDP